MGFIPGEMLEMTSQVFKFESAVTQQPVLLMIVDGMELDFCVCMCGNMNCQLIQSPHQHFQ